VLRFEFFEGDHDVYGQAEVAVGLAHVIRYGEDLTNLELPELEQPIIPVVVNETRNDEKRFRGLTPASVALLNTVPGFITLGKPYKHSPHTHLNCVLREMDTRTDLLAIACHLSCNKYSVVEVDEMINIFLGWDGQMIEMIRDGNELVISRKKV